MKKQDDAYALTNWAVACLLVRHLDPELGAGDWIAALTAQCVAQVGRETTREQQAGKEQHKPDFWLASGLGDLELVLMLLSAADRKACALRAVKAKGRYTAALARGASPREASSLRENLDFLIIQTRDWPAHVGESLADIQAAL